MPRTVEEHRRLRKEIRAELDALEAKDATLPWKTTRAEELLKLHCESVNHDRPERKFLGWTPPENVKPDADGATRGLPLFIFNFAPIESNLGGNVRKRHTNLEKDGLISPTMDVVFDALGPRFFDVPILEANPYLERHDAGANKTLLLGWEDKEDTDLKNDLQLAILTYFYGDDGPTAIGCFGGEAATWAADHIGDGTKAWKNYKGKTLKCVHPSIFRTTAPRAMDLMQDWIMDFGKLVEGVGGPSDAGEKLWAAKTQEGDFDQAMMEKLKREREAKSFGGVDESARQKKCRGPMKDRTQKAQDAAFGGVDESAAQKKTHGPIMDRTQKTQDVAFGGANESAAQKATRGPMEDRTQKAQDGVFGGANESAAQKATRGPMKDRTQKAQDAAFGGANESAAQKKTHGPMKDRTQKTQDVALGGPNGNQFGVRQDNKHTGLTALVVPEGCACPRCKSKFIKAIPATICVKHNKMYGNINWTCVITCPKCRQCSIKKSLNLIFDGQLENLHDFQKNMEERGKREIAAYKKALPAE